MPQIILQKRTANSASNIFFLREMLISIKTRHFDSSINHQEHLFHRTLITKYFRRVNIAKFLRAGFSYKPPEAVFLKVSQTSQDRKALVLESI